MYRQGCVGGIGCEARRRGVEKKVRMDIEPTPPTPDELRAQEQWLRDGTVPAEYVQAVAGGRFSTAEPLNVAIIG